MKKKDIFKRLYKDYTKKYINRIIVSVLFTVMLAASTSSIAYLLDPAIKQLFIEQKKSLMLIIPGLIVLAFTVKGSSLYIAKVIMISRPEQTPLAGYLPIPLTSCASYPLFVSPIIYVSL